MNSKRKAILSVMLIIAALSAIFLVQTTRSHRRHLHDSVDQHIDEARRIIESNLSAVKTLYKAQLRHITSHHASILEPFQQWDRQRLYEVALPVFQDMQRHPDFANMHFHLPDGRSFLRMHKPDEHGDDLTHIRPMIAQIHRDGTARDGYEFGVHGLFYWVAEPVIHEGHYLGVLEFGIRPNALIEGIETILDVEVALYASVTQRQEAEVKDGGKTSMLPASLWANGRGVVFPELSREQVEQPVPCEIRTPEGRFCVYRAGEIKGFEGDTIGHLLIAQNIDGQRAQYRHLVFISFLVTGGLILAAYVILHLSFGHMIQRILLLNRTLEQKVRERTEELMGEKKKVEATNTELAQIFETAAGGLRVIGTDYRTIRVNKTFKDMVDLGDTEMVGRPCYEVFPGPFCQTEHCPLSRILHGAERVELEVEKVRKSGRIVPCLLTATPWRSPEGKLLGMIEDFTDITTIRKLVEQQTINIGLAQRVLSFINSACSRYVDLDDSTALFFQALSSTCHAAGGDHYFMRQLPPNQSHPAGRTVLSLKDQSGHEVNCVLKSIATDLIHNTIIHASSESSLAGEVTRLNRLLTASSLFAADEFITAITVEIDHATRQLTYVSCGHPAFLAIRGGRILSFPADAGPGRHLPLAVSPHVEFTAGHFPLEPGDKLVFYTDGLTEMPISHLQEKLSLERLKYIVSGVLDEHEALPVSQVIRRTLDTVSEMSHEQVIPGADNTSADDVTLLGLEVESQGADAERVWHIASAEELSERIVESTEQIGAQARDEGFELDELRLRSVLDEALFNAWRHGNGCDPEKPIILRWRFRNDVHIEVLDEGPGFDHHNLQDPTEGANITGDSGRGLFMIRLYADHVCWKDDGRRIILSFRGPGDLDRRKKNRVQRVKCLNIWQHDPRANAARADDCP